MTRIIMIAIAAVALSSCTPTTGHVSCNAVIWSGVREQYGHVTVGGPIDELDGMAIDGYFTLSFT